LQTLAQPSMLKSARKESVFNILEEEEEEDALGRTAAKCARTYTSASKYVEDSATVFCLDWICLLMFCFSSQFAMDSLVCGVCMR
jgi:hypothetical protein